MSLLFWREAVYLKRMLVVAPTRSGGLFFRSAATFSKLRANSSVSSSAKQLFQKLLMRQPCYSLQHTPQGHAWAYRTTVQWACRKCQQNNARLGLSVAFASRRNFAVSPRLRQKVKDDVAKQTLKTESKAATVPKTSEVKRLLSQSRPEKWRILGGTLLIFDDYF